MIYRALGLLAVMSVAACSTSSSSTAPTPAAPAAPPTGTPTGNPGGTPPAAMPNITATNSNALAFGQTAPGAAFTASSATTPVTMVRTNNSTRPYRSKYDLTVNGVTYNLTPDPANTLGGANNTHTGSSGGNTVTMFTNAGANNATIFNPQITDASGATTQYFAVFGTLTDTASLPATASYAGNGEISIDKAGGAFDDAPNSTVTMDVDFSAGTLTGQFDVSDAGGDNGGNFDIKGTAVLPVTGTVSGAEFTANVDYSELVNITSGLNTVNAQPVTGGFFGAAADEAVGVGLSLGDSTSTDDVMIYTRIQATKQ